MEATFQSHLLDTTFYQTKYRSKWLAISDQNTLNSHSLSTFFKSVTSILHTLCLRQSDSLQKCWFLKSLVSMVITKGFCKTASWHYKVSFLFLDLNTWLIPFNKMPPQKIIKFFFRCKWCIMEQSKYQNLQPSRISRKRHNFGQCLYSTNMLTIQSCNSYRNLSF